MAIKRLSIDNLRNIHRLELAAQPQLNLFYGPNGAGKTSILEAVNLISLGRSFRHRGTKPLIRYQCPELTVFAEVENGKGSKRLGINKTNRGETTIHIDGRPVYSAAELAEVLPVLNLNAQSFELIGGPPKPRRQLLDWLTFHVEPMFLPAWKSLQNCLKQRNNLLRRDKISHSELDSWDRQLTDLTAKIDSYRSSAFERYLRSFESLGALLPEVGTITIRYKKGWSLDQDFGDSLKNNRNSDIERGYTQSGPHRADLRVKVDDQPAADALSRGQTKVVVAALVVALGQAFKDCTGKACTILVDDLPSELDVRHRQRVGAWLGALGAQLFVTAVDKTPLVTMWPQRMASSASLFHVEQGRIN